jgi:oligopeptide transport system substrate-binding protein
MLARAFSLLGLAASLALAGGCRESETGPIGVSAIGPQPQLVNPNLQPLPPPSAFLAEAVAQGLVRFDAAGEIEPALAQSWIVSDDGLRYTFRLRRAAWTDGSRVTAPQVVARLRAAVSRASRNPLKPVLGAIAEIEAMTDLVLEISLRGPRPNFLQLLAQPEMAIILNGRGTGPYTIAASDPSGVLLSLPIAEGDDEDEAAPSILLRGERAAIAVAGFDTGETDLVIGGTLGELPFARAAQPGDRLIFDPVNGLFGLAFAPVGEGPLADPAVRRALSMAINRQALVAAFGVPGLAARTSLVPTGIGELPAPAQPDWAGAPLPMRRQQAAETLAALGLEQPLRLRIAMPDGPGHRALFAHLRRDWRLIGVQTERVAPDAPADLRLVDEAAPAVLATWYLRHFTCEARAICDPAADLALDAARLAPTAAERRTQFAAAEGILTGLTPFIPLTAPVRWSLVSERLTGFRPNPFGRHAAGELIAERP